MEKGECFCGKMIIEIKMKSLVSVLRHPQKDGGESRHDLFSPRRQTTLCGQLVGSSQLGNLKLDLCLIFSSCDSFPRFGNTTCSSMVVLSGGATFYSRSTCGFEEQRTYSRETFKSFFAAVCHPGQHYGEYQAAAV